MLSNVILTCEWDEKNPEVQPYKWKPTAEVLSSGAVYFVIQSSSNP